MSQAGIINLGGGGGGGSPIETLTGNIGGAVPPTLNNIDILTANSTVLVAGTPSTSTLLLDFNAQTGPDIYNLIMGSSPLVTGENNTGVGPFVLESLTSSSGNTALGAETLDNLSTGNGFNTGLGIQAFVNLTTGASNIGISSSILAGENYNGSESSNIIIGNVGILGESNVTRIGTQGSGMGQQDQCFISGIRGATTTGATAVGIDINGKLVSPTVITNTSQPAFLAYLSTQQSNVTGDGTTFQIPFDTMAYDIGSNFTTGASAHYTFPVTGKYSISTNISVFSATAGLFQGQVIATSRGVQGFLTVLLNEDATISQSVLIDATAGDTLYVATIISGGAKTSAVLGGSSPYATFISGYLVS